MSRAAICAVFTVVLLVVVALFVSTVTGFLVWLDNQKPIDALLHAGLAFAGTLTLGATLTGAAAGAWAVVRHR